MREKIEKAFEDLTRHIYRNRIKYLVFMFVLIGVMSAPVYRLTVDTATESMLRENDPGLVEYNKYRDQFGRTEIITVLVEAPDIFSLKFLTKLEKFHNQLKGEVPYLKKVTSLINVRNTYEKNGTLYVDALMKNFKKRDLSEIKKRAFDNPFYRNNILSSDRKSTALMIETVAKVSNNPEGEEDFEDDLADEFEEDNKEAKQPEKDTFHYISAGEKAEINKAVKKIISEFSKDDFKITFSGGSVVVDVFNSLTSKDIVRMIKIMIVVIIIFLFLLFRRLSGVIMPFIIVNTAMVATLGMMAHTDTPISIMTNVLPGFLVAVGIADAVHVLTIFYREYDKGKSKEDAVCYAMGHSGLAILMTSVTTASGLLSFTIAEIATIAQMGYFASLGVILALLFTIVLLPALIAVTPIKRKHKTKGSSSDQMSRSLDFFTEFSVKHPKKIVAVSFLLFVVSLYYIDQLKFSNYILNYFPDNHYVRDDLEYIESKLEGSVAFEVVIDTEKENGLYDPAILNSIEKLSKKISLIKNEKIHVGKVITINDIIKETNQALNENRKEFYSIPKERKKIAENLLMFENSGNDDLELISDSIFSKTRFSIRTKWEDSVVFEEFLDELNRIFKDEFKDRAKITVTGLSAIMARTIPAALKSMLDSYIIALAVITILMLILVGDIKLGLLSMNPNLLPIFMVMGLIKITGNNLDINTLFIGSIALGLVVDDTIHFMYNFKKYYDITGSPEKAISETLQGTGRAMLITSIVLSLNFFVLLTGTLNHSVKFGFFTGVSIIFALLADFLLAPALMVLVNREKSV